MPKWAPAFVSIGKKSMENITSAEIILEQKKEIILHKESVYEIRRKLRIYKQNLNSHWQGEEMREINKSIEDMELHLRRTLEKLEELERKYNKELEAREAGEGLL